MCGCVSVVVSVFFLASDQWLLPVLQLSRNYTTVCGIWVFKRSNTVSILSPGIDLSRVGRRCKRSLAPFWCHTNSFAAFFCPRLFLLLLCARLSCMGNEPLKCHCHSDVIIEQRTAGGIGWGGEADSGAYKQKQEENLNQSLCIIFN